jgi:hypothetical protein
MPTHPCRVLVRDLVDKFKAAAARIAGRPVDAAQVCRVCDGKIFAGDVAVHEAEGRLVRALEEHHQGAFADSREAPAELA